LTHFDLYAVLFQLWSTRLSLLVKLKQFSNAEVEAEPFGDLDKPGVNIVQHSLLLTAEPKQVVLFLFGNHLKI
jgi:hypothetical protein